MGVVTSLGFSIFATNTSAAAFKQVEGQLAGTTAAMATASTRMTAAGAAMTKGITLPMVAIGTAAVAVAVQYDKAQKTIQTTTGATGKQLDDLNAVFRKVNLTTPAAIGDVAKAVADLSVKTGASGKTLETLSTAEIRFARLTGNDIPNVIDMTSKAFNAWGIKTNDQAKELDFLFKVTQQTGIGVGDLMSSVQRFAPTLQGMGFGFEESAAMIGQFSKAGVNTDQVLAGMKRGLATLAKSGQEPISAFKSMVEQIKHTGSAADATAMAVKLFGTRAGPDMAVAIRSGKIDLDGLLKSLNDSPVTLGSASAAAGTFQSKLTLMKKAAEEALLPLGKGLLDAIMSVMPFLVDFAKWVGKLGEVFATLPAPVREAAIAFGLFLLVIGPITSIIGGIIGAMGLFMICMAEVAAALGISLLAFEAIILVIVAVVAAIIWIATQTTWFQTAWAATWAAVKVAAETVWLGLQVIWNAVWGGMMAAWTAFITPIQNAWNTVFPQMQLAWQNIWGIVRAVWDALWPAIKATFDVFAAAFRAVWDVLWTGIQAAWTTFVAILTAVWTPFWNGLVAVASAAWEVLKAAWNVVWSVVTAVFTTFLAIFTGNWGVAWNAIKDAAIAVWELIKAAWNLLCTYFGAVWATVTAALGAAWSAFWNGIVAIAQAIWTGLQAVWSATWTAIQTIASAVWGAITAAFNAWLSAMSALWSTIWNAVSAVFSAIWGAIQATASAIWGAIQAYYSAAWAALQAAWSAVWTAIQAVASAIWGAIQAAFNAWLSAMSALWSTIWNAVSAVFSAIWGAIQATASAIWGAIQAYYSAAWAALQAAWSAFWTTVQTIFQTIWAAIQAVAQTIWNAIQAYYSAAWAVLQAAWQAFWTAVQTIFSTVWNAIKQYAIDTWNAIVAFFTAAWNTYQAAIQAFMNAVLLIWQTVWNAIKQFASDTWNAVVALADQFWKNIQTAFNAGKDWLLNTFWNPVHDFFTKTIPAAFDEAVTAVGKMWDRIKAIVRAPIQAVIDVVYNKGIVKVWNLIATKFGADSLDEYTLPQFRKGGAVHGSGTGTSDSIHARLSTGEHVWTKKEVQAAGGHGAMYAMRAQAVNGNTHRAGMNCGHSHSGPMKSQAHAFANGGAVYGFADGGMAGQAATGAGTTVTTGIGNSGTVGAAASTTPPAPGTVNPSSGGVQVQGGGGNTVTPARGIDDAVAGGLETLKNLALGAISAVAFPLIDAAATAGKVAVRAAVPGDGNALETAGTGFIDKMAETVKAWIKANDVAPAGGGFVPWTAWVAGDETRMNFRGVTVNRRTLAMLTNAEKLYGGAFQAYQGSYSSAVDASAGTHSGGGAVDVGPAEDAVVGAMRASGFAAWRRTPAEGFSPHVHGIAVGDMELSAAAAAQVTSFMQGRNGLADNGPDTYTAGGAVGGNVQAYAGLAAQALAAAGIPASQLGAFLALMQAESGGNPNAVNTTDSNAAAGDPSKGLMQVTGSTFATYGNGGNILDPYSNMLASALYIMAQYGGIVPGSPYKNGTNGAMKGVHLVGERGIEIVGRNGPELRKFKGGEKVIPNEDLMKKGGRGGDVHCHFTIDARGATVEAVKRLETETPARILAAVKQGVGRRR